MKAILTFTLLVLFTGCVSLASPFVQDDIKIVPPVKQQLDTQGKKLVIMFHDGGTKQIKITDAEGRTFDIYIDHRLFTKTPGAIYLNAYPDTTNSVRVLNQQDFTRKIGAFE
jgi:ABC-type Fe3+-hydroxamate transport system substrate-binding protein